MQKAGESSQERCEAGQWGSCGVDSRWRGASSDKEAARGLGTSGVHCPQEVAPFLGHQKP